MKDKDYPSPVDAVRSYTMSRIKSKNTSIESSLRRALWRAGIRYRKNYQNLPGTPDIAITKHRIAVFCDGDFWHGRDWDTKNVKIQNNREYWIAKIERNIAHDEEVNAALTELGWSILRFWGSDIKKNLRGCVYQVRRAITIKQLEGVIEITDHRGYAEVGDSEELLLVAEEAGEYQ
jgi:DNA mismatch endonuclease (patch repair protein)